MLAANTQPQRVPGGGFSHAISLPTYVHLNFLIIYPPSKQHKYNKIFPLMGHYSVQFD